MHQHHELLKTALEIYIKKELDLQRKNLWDYACKQVCKLEVDRVQWEEFKNIFETMNFDPKEFARNLHMILTKKDEKINTLRLIGTANSCKSLLARCIVAPFICSYNNNHASENEFYLSNFLNKSIILCEELYLTVATAEDFKSVLGGASIDIAKKHNEKQLMCRTPIIITSNHQTFGRGHIPPIDESALSLRCIKYNFLSSYKPKTILCWQQFYLYMLSVIM